MKQTRTVGILAHVDAGKTTLSEQILFQAHTIRRAGRVDHQDSFLDTNPMEKQRGITIFCGQAPFVWKEAPWYLVDTPSDPPLSVPGAPELTAEDIELVEAYRYIVPADAEKKAVTDSAAIQEVLDLLHGAAATDTPPEALAGGAVVSFRLTLTTGEVREWICAEAADTLWAVAGPEGNCETMMDCAALWEGLPGEAEAAPEAQLPVLP